MFIYIQGFMLAFIATRLVRLSVLSKGTFSEANGAPLNYLGLLRIATIHADNCHIKSDES
ncbi:hypothetical protein PA25_33560 [Pseudoalteromonas sp. A25]|nr:hypothetical protein PA25_33560 [Pseudoalteromonas sp. A25]